jgi:outer membrane protein TolC
VDKSRTQVTLGRSDYLPDLMLQYRRRDMADGMDSHDAMVGFTLPLWFWKQGAMVREARAERDMAQAEYQNMKNMTTVDVKSLLVKVQTLNVWRNCIRRASYPRRNMRSMSRRRRIGRTR